MVILATTKTYKDHWATPHQKHPFDVPIAEKLALLRDVTEVIKKQPKVSFSNANLSCRSKDKFLATSEGSWIQQLILQIYPNLSGTAVDMSRALSRTRR